MKYKCLNPECGREFIHPAKQIVPVSMKISEDSYLADAVKTGMFVAQLEISVCPYCQKPNYDEIPEVAEQVEGVYVHDLQSGVNAELDAKLKDGWKIVNRFAKQYHLEKVTQK